MMIEDPSFTLYCYKFTMRGNQETRGSLFAAFVLYILVIGWWRPNYKFKKSPDHRHSLNCYKHTMLMKFKNVHSPCQIRDSGDGGDSRWCD